MVGVTLLAVACFTYMLIQLRRRGQPWYADRYSQRFIDVWSLSHVLHGVVLYGVWWMLLPLPRPELICMAVATECLWESFENRNAVINWFRKTDKLYFGDSVVNSVGDLLACTLGAFGTGAVIQWLW